MRQFRGTCSKCKFTMTVEQATKPADKVCPVFTCQRDAVTWRQLVVLKRRPDMNAHLSIAITRPRRGGGMKRSYRDLDEDDDEQLQPSAKRAKAAVLDYDWSPHASTFTPSLRLTTQSASRRATFSATSIRGGVWARVAANPAGRGSTNQVMGNALNKRQPLSANDHATKALATSKHAKPFAVPYEWCHVLADCLGGATAADNLTAGGRHANTHMMFIEMAVKGRTYLEVRVEVGESAPHVAEYFTYSVREVGSARPELRITIDSRSRGFSKADRDAVHLLVSGYVQQCKGYKSAHA